MGNARRKVLAAQRARRRRIGAVLVVVALLAGAAIYMFVLRDSTTVPTATGGPNAAEMFEGEPTELVYADFADGSDIHRLDLGSGEDATVGALPRSGDTTAAPGSTWLSVQAVEEVGDRFSPALFLYDTATEEEIALGTGYEPSWSPEGDRLAFISPDDTSRCGEEECRGPRKVMVVSLPGGEPEELTASSFYGILGWAGEYVVVVDRDQSGSPIAQTISPTGKIEDLPILPIEFWGASPDGRWIIQSGDSGTRFIEMTDGVAGAAGEDITIPEGTILGAGSWAHDSSLVAARALSEDRELEIVTFSPADPAPRPISPAGESSLVGILWSPENDGFVFQRFTGDELEAVHCPTGDPEGCEVLFAWTRGISLLRIE